VSKAYTEDDLSRQLQQDRTWRLKEISDLKSIAKRSDEAAQSVVLRALVALSYAHWEGSVRFAAQKFFEHVSLRKLRYQDLDKQFLKNYFLPRLAALSVVKTSMAERCALVDEILSSSDRRFSRTNDDLVNTKANLNSEVLRDICLVCGIDFAEFEGDANFIDVLLLKRRNEIAHGEDTRIGMNDLDDITNRTIGLMRTFGNAIENRVCNGSYRVVQQGGAAFLGR
jgi:hypothetical protein